MPNYFKIDQIECGGTFNVASDRSAVPIDSTLIGQLPQHTLMSEMSSKEVEGGFNKKRLVSTG